MKPVDDILDKGDQVDVAFSAFTEGESFDIVLGAAPSGLEALRRFVRRGDPPSGGKRRALLRQIIVSVGANYKTFPRDSRSGTNWCADTKEANQAER